MPYHLHVTAGPSLDLFTHSLISVNDEDHPTEIQSSHFRGRITVRVRDFPGSSTQPPISSPYFIGKTATFSLQCQGQYGDLSQSNNLTTDDLMFGIVLREPLSETSPLGLKLIERIMRFFWPIMESNLRDSSPWILSPLFATMSRIHIHPERSFNIFPRHNLPPWPGIMPDAESENAIGPRTSSNGPPSRRSRAISTSESELLSPHPPPQLVSHLSLSPRTSTAPDAGADPKTRKKHFSSLATRKAMSINPSDTITAVFHNSFIDFRSLSLSVPGVPFKIDLSRYMVGRPAQYVCRDREGNVFWAIVFTILEDR